MSIFIRKHRHSILSFLLPILFLGLTVVLIQCGSDDSNAPQEVLNGVDGSDLGGECIKDSDCVTSTTLGDLVCNTITNKCQSTNVGCDVTDTQVEVEQTANTCICVDVDTGENVGPCVVCPVNEIVVGGGCCDPAISSNLPGGCPQLEGSGL